MNRRLMINIYRSFMAIFLAAIFAVLSVKWQKLLLQVWWAILLGIVIGGLALYSNLKLDSSIRVFKAFNFKGWNFRWIFFFIMGLITIGIGFFIDVAITGQELATLDPNVAEPTGLSLFIYPILSLTVYIGGLWIYFGHRQFNPHPNVKPNTIKKIAYVLFTITLIIGIPIGLSFLPRAGASFPYQYSWNAGPVVQFGPYEDNKAVSTSTSMVIWWYTKDDAGNDCTLKFGTDPIPASMMTATEIKDGDGHRHQVNLEGLKPNTTYYYQIPGFNGDKIYNFTTSPAESAAPDFRFVSVGDTRNGGGSQSYYYGEINRIIGNFYGDIGEKPAFVLNLGDINAWGPDIDSWHVFFDDIKDQAPYIPFMVAVGNHEYGGDRGANYKYLMSYPVYYSFNYSGVHVLSFNTFDKPGTLTTIGEEQLQFIERDLANNMNKNWIIVAFHVPFFTTEVFREDLYQTLFPIFEKYNVDLVLTAHDHHFDAFVVDEDNELNKTLYIVNGGGGAELDSYLITGNWDGRWNLTSDCPQIKNFPEIIRDYYVYGEISWGFVDIQIRNDLMNVTYYRWLTYPRLLEITNQPPDTGYGDYKMPSFSEEEWQQYGLDNVYPVLSLTKTRSFD